MSNLWLGQGKRLRLGYIKNSFSFDDAEPTLTMLVFIHSLSNFLIPKRILIPNHLPVNSGNIFPIWLPSIDCLCVVGTFRPAQDNVLGVGGGRLSIQKIGPVSQTNLGLVSFVLTDTLKLQISTSWW